MEDVSLYVNSRRKLRLRLNKCKKTFETIWECKLGLVNELAKSAEQFLKVDHIYYRSFTRSVDDMKKRSEWYARCEQTVKSYYPGFGSRGKQFPVNQSLAGMLAWDDSYLSKIDDLEGNFENEDFFEMTIIGTSIKLSSLPVSIEEDVRAKDFFDCVLNELDSQQFSELIKSIEFLNTVLKELLNVFEECKGKLNSCTKEFANSDYREFDENQRDTFMESISVMDNACSMLETNFFDEEYAFSADMKQFMPHEIAELLKRRENLYKI
ncbi:hypothetical protein SAMN05720764_10814 [Fibrobacter sp. UWH5]|uniref:hypothetical protein n=1 Tax=Fibrobacter sp. UWH5 TaxID=1896211 RepID=UPI0009132B16|nr:hypothetical protein [Fibrobacter sp. UWH5]SHL12077.1 hypothetical protein SAMN05720764_10814 [Fibrobacter sp. UWH5]